MTVVTCEESAKVVRCPWVPRKDKGKVSEANLLFQGSG